MSFHIQGGRCEGAGLGSGGGFGCGCGAGCFGGLEGRAAMIAAILLSQVQDVVWMLAMVCAPFVLFAAVVLVLVWMEGGDDDE